MYRRKLLIAMLVAGMSILAYTFWSALLARTRPYTGDIEIDLGRYELRRGGHRVKLEPQPLELLILLVEKRGLLVSREHIVARLWGDGVFLDTERSINNSIRKIRSVLGDDPAQPRLIETVHGRGYRFVGTVHVVPAAAPDAPAAVLTAQDPNAWRSQHQQSSLVVLPFMFLSGAEQQRGLSLGFADALITALGNLEGFFVLPTSAVVKYIGDVDPATVASRFGVRYVLQGTIQAHEARSRISVQMFDAEAQTVTFAQSFDVDLKHVLMVQDQIAKQVADALNRRFREHAAKSRDRYSKDPQAYAEFVKGYGGSASDDPRMFDESIQHLSKALEHDPRFALAHALLSFVCANKHFEFDPSRTWLDKAEFHVQRALELDPQLPEAHLANAYILWGPSKNFQHLQAIAELRRALALQPNLPHAYNRLGSILAHIGLLDEARNMYEQGRCFEPRGIMSHGITQVYLWQGQFDLAQQQIVAWRSQNPRSKYPLWYSPQPALYQAKWDEARRIMDEVIPLIGDDPLVSSLDGVLRALMGETEAALQCARTACESPKSFGHAHHTYHQIACIHAVLGRTKSAMEWLEKTVDTGLACWPFFRIDPCFRSLRELPEFQSLLTALEEKYGVLRRMVTPARGASGGAG